MDWKLALPLHPGIRVPCRWSGTYALSPISHTLTRAGCPHNGNILRRWGNAAYSVQYGQPYARAGDFGPISGAKADDGVRHALAGWLVDVTDARAIEEVGLSIQQVEEMYRYGDCQYIESGASSHHREMARVLPERNGCGFTFGDGCHGSDAKFNLFSSSRIDAIVSSPKCVIKRNNANRKAIGLLMEYRTTSWRMSG